MPFDTRAWVEANSPPVFIDLDGKTYTGRLWSHLEYIKWLRVFQAWVAGDQNARPPQENATRARRTLEPRRTPSGPSRAT